MKVHPEEFQYFCISSQVLATQMKHYTESRDIDNISRLQGEVSDVKDILVKNIGGSVCCVWECLVRECEIAFRKRKWGVNYW